MRVAAVIPALNEAETVADTVSALLSIEPVESVVVVDDGSSDGTSRVALAAGAQVVRLERNFGKSRALAEGVWRAAADVLLLVDADLGPTARSMSALLVPVLDGRADMTVGVVAPVPGAGGMGLVRRLASVGLRSLGVDGPSAPLSGQRALTRRAWNTLSPYAGGWSVDLALSVGVHRAGLTYMEIPVPARHRVTSRDLAGYLHRGRQFRDISLYLLRQLASDRWPRT